MLSEQDLTININNKNMYGEVHSPYSLIEEMFALLPEEIFYDREKKWLDPGTGKGFFSLFLFNKLMNTLTKSIPDPILRKNHILKNMIYMVEVNPEHSSLLYSSFQSDYLNLITDDYIPYNFSFTFDVILGNPPFNSEGIKKVPTNKQKNKKQDGKTIWSEFIKKSISLLKPNGLLLFITPSIWMKADKAKMFEYITQFKLHKLHSLTNTEMNKIFKGHAQTPSCYFLLEKKSTDKKVLLYDKDMKEYIEFPIRGENILPVSCAGTLIKLLPYVDEYGALTDVIKTNLPSSSIRFSSVPSSEFPYANIRTCVISNKTQPELVIEYSDKPCPFYGKPKLVLAHGMYGFPYVDSTGKYGISNRDKYVFLRNSVEELEELKTYLSSDIVFYLFNATRYRMKYLEKYIFYLLPKNLQYLTEIDVKKIPKNKYDTL
jgi:hypothetical protein